MYKVLFGLDEERIFATIELATTFSVSLSIAGISNSIMPV